MTCPAPTCTHSCADQHESTCYSSHTRTYSFVQSPPCTHMHECTESLLRALTHFFHSIHMHMHTHLHPPPTQVTSFTTTSHRARLSTGAWNCCNTPHPPTHPPTHTHIHTHTHITTAAAAAAATTTPPPPLIRYTSTRVDAAMRTIATGLDAPTRTRVSSPARPLPHPCVSPLSRTCLLHHKATLLHGRPAV
jgi:hypothetical protein